MANENQDPYDQAYWGKGKGKTGKKGKSKLQYPYDGNKGYPSYDSGKGKGGHDKGTSKTFAATAGNLEEQSARAYVDRPRLGSVMELDETSSTGQISANNEVFDLVDTRKIQVRNWVTGAREGRKLSEDQGCWGIRGFQDKQKNDQQTDSPAASRSGFRLAILLTVSSRITNITISHRQRSTIVSILQDPTSSVWITARRSRSMG